MKSREQIEQEIKNCSEQEAAISGSKEHSSLSRAIRAKRMGLQWCLSEKQFYVRATQIVSELTKDTGVKPLTLGYLETSIYSAEGSTKKAALEWFKDNHAIGKESDYLLDALDITE